MRGKGFGDDAEIAGIGITPAYAGKSKSATALAICHGDHPRLCGEKSYETSRFLWQIGSPPPMRGKVGVRACLPA